MTKARWSQKLRISLLWNYLTWISFLPSTRIPVPLVGPYPSVCKENFKPDILNASHSLVINPHPSTVSLASETVNYVFLKPSRVSRKDAQGHCAKRSKKSSSGEERGGEGKERKRRFRFPTPPPTHLNFCSFPSCASLLPLGSKKRKRLLHMLSKSWQEMRYWERKWYSG